MRPFRACFCEYGWIGQHTDAIETNRIWDGRSKIREEKEKNM